MVDMATLARMPIKIDLRSREPSYLQLAAILRGRIESGEIRPEGALPSITFLVQETGLAVGTVRKAIKVLADEGLVVTVPGRGSFATKRRGR
jgi:GntR family transcriptional regulator